MALRKMLIKEKVCYYFDSRFFEVDGRKFEIIGSRSTGLGAHAVIHDIRDMETGMVFERSMVKIIDKLKHTAK